MNVVNVFLCSQNVLGVTSVEVAKMLAMRELLVCVVFISNLPATFKEMLNTLHCIAPIYFAGLLESKLSEVKAPILQLTS